MGTSSPLSGASHIDSLCIIAHLFVFNFQEEMTKKEEKRLTQRLKKLLLIKNYNPTKSPSLQHTHAHRPAHISPITLSTRSFLKPVLYLLSVTCALIAHNPCTDQWRLCYLLVGNCPLHQYSVCAGSNAASPGVLLMSLMCD